MTLPSLPSLSLINRATDAVAYRDADALVRVLGELGARDAEELARRVFEEDARDGIVACRALHVAASLGRLTPEGFAELAAVAARLRDEGRHYGPAGIREAIGA